MNDSQDTEKVILRKMNPAASQRILNYLVKELIKRNLLQPPDQSKQSESPEAVPEEK